MKSKGIFSLELFLGETQQKHISTSKKLAQVKNEMSRLGLISQVGPGFCKKKFKFPMNTLKD
jgi:hypothetical protein